MMWGATDNGLAEELRECKKQLDSLRKQKQRVGVLVLDRLEEVTNQRGGVIGYKLNLDALETEKLCRELEIP